MKTFAAALMMTCLVAMLCFLSGAGQAADMRPKIAILPFDTSLGKNFKALGDGMPDIVTACFTAENVFADILDRSALSAIGAEQTINFDPSKIKKVEGVTHLLRGSLAPQDTGIIVTLMLYDLASTKLVASVAASGDLADIPATACAGVRQLGDKLSALSPVASPEKGMTDAQAEQSRLMIEGLGAYYNGAYEKAFPPFMKLMRADPTNASAVYWLARSYQGAGMDEQARLEFDRFLKDFPKDPRAPEVSGLLKEKKE
ncbi:MAG: tetratricopeptide repeat protein [Alphaproteobacteria bacterium]